MKIVKPCLSWFGVIVFFVTATSALSQEKTEGPQPPAGAPVKPAVTTGPRSGVKVLTEDEIAALLTEWTNEKTGKKLVFRSSFGTRKVTPQEQRSYARSGKVPVRITCELLEVKESNGRTISRRVTGDKAHVYIVDPEGKVVESKSLALDKMCPS